MTYVVTEPCVDVLDRSCIEVCPVDCIYEGGRMMYINADECVDCGACEPVCPHEAIYFEDDLPEQFDAFARSGRDFFTATGAHGGGGPAGRTAFDTDLVSGLPRRSSGS